MVRLCLSDARWTKMEPHRLGKKRDPGRTGSDGRLFLEAVLWIARIGGSWRDLPEMFGNGKTVFKRLALRADKTDPTFEAMIYAAAAGTRTR